MTVVPPEIPLLSPRPRDAHKGTMGRLVIIGGSPGLTGAVSLAAHAALRSGAGLVTCAVASGIHSILEVKCTEPMSVPLPDDGGKGILGAGSIAALDACLDRADAVVVGPGIGRAEETSAFLRELLPALEIPCLIDADALWHLSRLPQLWASGSLRVLTPHEGEFRRLHPSPGGLSTRVDLEAEAVRMAHERGVTVVLKGPGSLVTDGERRFSNPTGNAGLATGGSGDVLAGILGAFLARGDSAWNAAVRGVFVHGLAGDLAARKLGEDSLIAGDVIDHLPGAFAQLPRQ